MRYSPDTGMCRLSTWIWKARRFRGWQFRFSDINPKACNEEYVSFFRGRGDVAFFVLGDFTGKDGGINVFSRHKRVHGR